ncbi:MAG: hypothetical protein M0T77_09610 [Actinomycetota bacterium]|nr:hypothetical protein [Actinomycetota bacterium]
MVLVDRCRPRTKQVVVAQTNATTHVYIICDHQTVFRAHHASARRQRHHDRAHRHSVQQSVRYMRKPGGPGADTCINAATCILTTASPHLLRAASSSLIERAARATEEG